MHEVTLGGTGGIHRLTVELRRVETGVNQSSLLSSGQRDDVDLIGSTGCDAFAPRSHRDGIARLHAFGNRLPVDVGTADIAAGFRSVQDPLTQDAEFFGSERLRLDLIGQRRHRRRFLPSRDEVQQALVRLTGNDRRPAFAALRHPFDSFKVELALGRPDVVTRDAVEIENVSNVLLIVHRPPERDRSRLNGFVSGLFLSDRSRRESDARHSRDEECKTLHCEPLGQPSW